MDGGRLGGNAAWLVRNGVPAEAREADIQMVCRSRPVCRRFGQWAVLGSNQ
jgi:hypothetical protein